MAIPGTVKKFKRHAHRMLAAGAIGLAALGAHKSIDKRAFVEEKSVLQQKAVGLEAKGFKIPAAVMAKFRGRGVSDFYITENYFSKKEMESISNLNQKTIEKVLRIWNLRVVNDPSTKGYNYGSRSLHSLRNMLIFTGRTMNLSADELRKLCAKHSRNYGALINQEFAVRGSDEVTNLYRKVISFDAVKDNVLRLARLQKPIPMTKEKLNQTRARLHSQLFAATLWYDVFIPQTHSSINALLKELPKEEAAKLKGVLEQFRNSETDNWDY